MRWWRWTVFAVTGRVSGAERQPAPERRVVGADEAAGLGLTARPGAHDDYEATTGHATTCGSGFGMGCQCDTVPVPRDALRSLVKVARYVADCEPWPDPVPARNALADLDDAGLLDQFKEED